EAQYGEKVECRIIVWPFSLKGQVTKQYAELRDSEERFSLAARSQPASELASAGGKLRPVGRYTLANRAVEEALFKMRPAEGRQRIPDGDEKDAKPITLIKCDGRLPADTTKSFPALHDELAKTVFERKLVFETGKYFQELREKAGVKFVCDDPKKMDEL